MNNLMTIGRSQLSRTLCSTASRHFSPSFSHLSYRTSSPLPHLSSSSSFSSSSPSSFFYRRSFSSSSAASSESSGTPLTILFGSQTGKAMGLAHELRKVSKRRPLHWKPQVVDLAEFSSSDHLTPEGITLLVTACFGHGEPTDNAKQFYKWLFSPTAKDSVNWKNIKFTVFGLGQSKHYPERYQQVSKEFFKRLEELGATPVLPRGEGDDSNDIDADFESWSNEFFNKMESIAKDSPKEWKEMFGSEPVWTTTTKKSSAGAAPSTTAATTASAQPSQAAEQETKQTPSSPSNTASTKSTEESICTPRKIDGPVPDVRRPYSSRLLFTQELYTPEAQRSCSYLKFDINDSRIQYSTGDYLGVFPRNAHNEVKAVAKRLKLDLMQEITVKEHPFLVANSALLGDQEKVTVATVLSAVADLQSPPSRSVLRTMAEHASDINEREKLLFLASNDELAKQDYTSFILNDKRTLLEVLNCFPSVSQVSADELADLIPPLRNRFYSICSSPIVAPNHIEIVASNVDFITPTGRRHRGLSTRFLSERCEGDRVNIFVKQSLFRPPKDPLTPIIMFGAGTGVAPFKAFIDERMLVKSSGKSVGPTVLFFGCCHPRQDFLFSEEFSAAEKAGVLTLKTAFSHEYSYRIFVQHRMIEEENRKLIWGLLNNGAQIYVCGSAQRLAPAVHEALRIIVEKEGKINDPLGYLKKLQEQGKYSLDIF